MYLFIFIVYNTPIIDYGFVIKKYQSRILSLSFYNF